MPEADKIQQSLEPISFLNHQPVAMYSVAHSVHVLREHPGQAVYNIKMAFGEGFLGIPDKGESLQKGRGLYHWHVLNFWPIGQGSIPLMCKNSDIMPLANKCFHKVNGILFCPPLVSESLLYQCYFHISDQKSLLSRMTTVLRPLGSLYTSSEYRTFATEQRVNTLIV